MSIENPADRLRHHHLSRAGLQKTAPALALANRIIVARKRLAELHASALEGLDIGVGEADFLMAMRVSHAGTCTPSDLGRQFALTSAGVTRRLDVLESAGLIERRAHPNDRRSIALALTRSGEHLADDVIARKANALKSALEDKLNEAQLNTLIDGLSDFTAALGAARK